MTDSGEGEVPQCEEAGEGNSGLGCVIVRTCTFLEFTALVKFSD